MFDPDQAMEMIERLDFPRVCGSAGEAHAIGLLAEELNTLGVKTWYDWFEESWIDPVDALLVVGQATTSVSPAVTPFDVAQGRLLLRVGSGVSTAVGMSEPVSSDYINRVLLRDVRAPRWVACWAFPPGRFGFCTSKVRAPSIVFRSCLPILLLIVTVASYN